LEASCQSSSSRGSVKSGSVKSRSARPVPSCYIQRSPVADSKGFTVSRDFIPTRVASDVSGSRGADDARAQCRWEKLPKLINLPLESPTRGNDDLDGLVASCLNEHRHADEALRRCCEVGVQHAIEVQLPRTGTRYVGKIVGNPGLPRANALFCLTSWRSLSPPPPGVCLPREPAP